MSSLVSLYTVANNDLPAIVKAAGSARAQEAIHQLGTELDEEYGWSGHVMLNVLNGLGRLKIPLSSPELTKASKAINLDYEYTTLIASNAKAYLSLLDPAAYEPGDLLDGPIELELDDEEARYAVEETLSLLRETIARLSEDEVILLHID